MTRTSQIQNPESEIRKRVIGHWALVVVVSCAVALVPLLRSEAPCTHDGAFHYFRVAALRHALQEGIPFTRFLPDLAFGYGYPFFNYRAALSYCLALALHATGLALPVALNLVYASSIVGSALTAYLLARDLFGPQAGVVAAVAYAYAPYQFLDALLRANMPETVALPLLPLVLWTFRRLALTGHRRWFLASVGSLAALLLTHNISSLLFAPFLVAYLALLWLVRRREGYWAAVGGALALAFGLTAFFWGPALLERDYVQLHMSRVTRNNDFHYNFLSLAEILAPPAPVDTSLMNPPMRVHLGLAQAILAGVGLVWGLARWRDRERRATLIFLAFAAVAMLWMSTHASLWLWEHVPLLAFVQFPWRLVGRAALPVALLAGALAASPPAANHASRITHHVSRLTHHASRITHHASRITYFIIATLLILAAFPYTYPPHGYCRDDPYPTIMDVFAYERDSALVGVDPEGSYFPVWVEQRPKGSPLEHQYAAGGPVARFNETALPTGASLVEADYGPNRARLVVEAPIPFQARYLAFYFPGWRAWVDGEPTKLMATNPDGLIAFDVPAGRHTIVVRFGATPIRGTFTVVSLLSLAALLVVALRYPDVQRPTSEIRSRGSESQSWSFVIGHLSFLLLLAFKLTVVDRRDTVFRRPALQPDSTLPGIEHRLDRAYADGLTLMGYDQEHTTIDADGTLRLDLYWTARDRPNARYQTVLHLVGDDGLRWSLPDSFRPRGYADYPPTNTWSPGRYALDGHEIEPLPGTPPGAYDVVLTVFDRDTLAPLSVVDDQGQPAAPTLTLGEATLTPPRRPTDLEALDIRRRFDTPLGPLTLLGAEFDRDEAAPGDPVLLSTFWRADRQPVEDLAVHLTLLASDGSAAATYDLPPTASWHPTSIWQSGDVWRGQHIVHLPPDLDGGDYTWQLGLSQAPAHPVAGLSIAAPERTYAPPSLQYTVDTNIGNVATLVGFDIEAGEGTLQPGGPLTVTLTWRAEDTISASYHVFLHLLDSGGRLIAQSDGVPADWSRPTTGWMPGEYVTDVRILTIPPDAPAGDYTLSTGLYAPGGERLTTPDGADAVHLTTIRVRPQ